MLSFSEAAFTGNVQVVLMVNMPLLLHHFVLKSTLNHDPAEVRAETSKTYPFSHFCVRTC